MAGEHRDLACDLEALGALLDNERGDTLVRGSLPTRAMTIVKSASCTRLTQIFPPLITHSLPAISALVVMPDGSSPAPGSEMAMALFASPRA
jgi:hypothetical protein